MTDCPIIFSAPMVRALLAGRKTQTRRLASSPLSRCVAGDRLYVRESAAIRYAAWHHKEGYSYQITYAANFTHGQCNDTPSCGSHIRKGQPPKYFPSRSHNADGSMRWCPSIHLPRWASRLTLTVEAVRTEPLHAISEADALAEGAAIISYARLPGMPDGTAYWHGQETDDISQGFESATASYRHLWDSLRPSAGQRWQDNPEVLVLSFAVRRGNIDG